MSEHEVELTSEEATYLEVALHSPTEVGNAFGGYDCSCGAPWLTAGCADGVEGKWEQAANVRAAVEVIIAARLADAEARAEAAEEERDRWKTWANICEALRGDQ